MIATAKRLEIVEEYYFSSKLREVRQLAAEGKPIINMGIGSPDLKPSQAVIDAVVLAMQEENAHQYQSYQGVPELRQSMADFYQNNFGVAMNPTTEILPLMGSKEGIMHLSMAYLNEGDQVLIPNPGYPTYTSVTRLLGAEPVYYDLTAQNKWLPDFNALAAMDLSRVKIMWLSYPHMPTGAHATASDLQPLVDLAKSKALPSNEELEMLWYHLLEEMNAQGEVKHFTGTIVDTDGNFSEEEVIRVGPWTAFDRKGNFLGYIKFKRAIAKSKKMLNFDKESISIVQNDTTGAIIATGELTIVGIPDEFF